jgi:hypothetical protein
VNPFYALITPVEQPSQPPGGQPPGTQPPVRRIRSIIRPSISGPPGPWPSPPIAGIPGLPGYNPPGGQPPGGGGGQPPIYYPPGIWGGLPARGRARRSAGIPACRATSHHRSRRAAASLRASGADRTSRSRRRRSRAFPACRATSLRGAVAASRGRSRCRRCWRARFRSSRKRPTRTRGPGCWSGSGPDRSDGRGSISRSARLRRRTESRPKLRSAMTGRVSPLARLFKA